MFLIYNFHLTEATFRFREGYIKRIEEVLMRNLSAEDIENIGLYGIEAFFLASLKKLDENHLFEAWKKMNRLWTILNSAKVTDQKLEDEPYYLNFALKSFSEREFFKLGTSLDHLIKIYEKTLKISQSSLEALFDFFPFLLSYKKTLA